MSKGMGQRQKGARSTLTPFAFCFGPEGGLRVARGRGEPPGALSCLLGLVLQRHHQGACGEQRDFRRAPFWPH